MRRLAAALALLLALAGCTTTVRQHPDFVARRARITTVAIMPPDVHFVRRVFRGDDEPMLEEAQAVRLRLPELLAPELARRGFTLKPALLDDAHLAAEPELRYQTTLVQSRFANAGGRLQPFAGMKRANAARTRMSLGPDVNRFADHAAVDGLLFAQMGGWTKSGGEIMKDFAMSLMLLGNVRYYRKVGGLQVALVDGSTGEILWANAALVTDKDFTDAALPGMVHTIFDGFPH